MRSTAYTFYADDGENIRLVTVRHDGDKYVALTNPGQSDIGDPWTYGTASASDSSPTGQSFIGVAAARRTLQALVQADGRRTSSAVSMFVIPSSMFRTTTGRRAGRWETFPEMVEHVTRYSADAYKGETHADRIADAIGILTQRVWEE